jgi:hypothetical protein
VFADFDLGRRRGFCEQRQHLGRCHPQGTKGATMTDDAVRNGAIAREVGEELFLEQSRQWIIDIRRERLLPEVLEYLRSFECRSEERRKESEFFFNLRLDLFARSREPRLVIAWRLSGGRSRFHNLVYQGYSSAPCWRWIGDGSDCVIWQSTGENSRSKARLFPHPSYQHLVKPRNWARFRWHSKCEY